MTRKQLSGGKLSGCGHALGKTKRIRPSVGEKGPKTVQRQAEAANVGQKWPKAVEQGGLNLCIHIKWGVNLGDFQGVVTLGVAGDPKCIFPYRGEGFLEGAAPHVHAKRGVHGPCRCLRRCKMARKTRLCYPKTRLCYRKNTVERGQKTRCSGDKRHDFVTEKHGPSGARNTNMLPKNTDHAG